MERPRFGRWGAVTALTPLRPGWSVWLRLVFLFGRSTNVAVRPLIRSRVIALGRWTLLPRRGRPDVMVFETNWSGAWENYIADFGRTMPWQWRFIWGGTERFPGPLPTTGLLGWVDEIDKGVDHYYSGYSEGATTQGIVRALALRSSLERFVDEVDGAGPDEFARRWRRFAADVQGLV